MKFYALDFDRTLGRTIDIAEDFMSYVGAEDVAIGGVLREQQYRIESTGGSFDMIEVLRAQMGQRVLGECIEGFLRQYRGGQYLEDGVDALLGGIAATGHQLGILTYGGEDWQMIKLQVTELDSYHRIILGEKGKKGALIASWYDAERDVYQLPEELGGGTVEQVVLVDDKPLEFVGFPDTPSAHGYLYTGGVKPTVETSPQPTMGDLPSNVTVVGSLRDVVRYETLE